MSKTIKQNQQVITGVGQSPLGVGFFILSLTLLLVILAAYIRADRDYEFPVVTEGEYLGAIDGWSENPHLPFYLQSLNAGQEIKLIFFAPGTQSLGTQSQVIAPEWKDGSKQQAYQPLEFQLAGHTYALAGQQAESNLRGKMIKSPKKPSVQASWSLKKLSRDGASPADTDVPEDFYSRLAVRARAGLLTKERDKIVAELADLNKSKSIIEDLPLPADSEFNERVNLERLRLQDELTQDIKKRDNLAAERLALAREIKLRGKINRKGRAVESERKISRREENWYLARWAPGAGQDVMTEQSDQSEADSAQSEAAYRQALNAQKLSQQIKREKALIASFEQDILNKQEPDVKIEADEGKEEKKDTSFWDRIF